MNNSIIPTHLNLTPEEIARYETYFHAGLRHGKGFAASNVPTIGDRIHKTVDWWGLLGPVVTEANAQEYHRMLCCHAEENSRQYSPFKHTAKTLNEDDVLGSELSWEAFEHGMHTTINEEVKAYYPNTNEQ